MEEICKCPPYVRIEIMRDHTNLDWRDFIPHINLPTLVCVARNSNVFDWHGSAWVGENIPGARTVFLRIPATCCSGRSRRNLTGQ